MALEHNVEQRLAALVASLRPASQFHLMQALAAAETEGVSGTLVVKIPRKPGDMVDVSFVGGTARLVLEM